MNDNSTEIRVLEQKILFWTDKMNSSKSNVECAVLSDKIREAKNKIAKLRLGNEPEKTIKSHFDPPLIVDKEDKKKGNMTRGQVIDTGSSISFNL